jgi:hypothetical protein
VVDSLLVMELGQLSSTLLSSFSWCNSRPRTTDRLLILSIVIFYIRSRDGVLTINCFSCFSPDRGIARQTTRGACQVL